MTQEAAASPRAPEILLVEEDAPLKSRGGVYTAADCYLFPLRAEGFGMTILEAMACGLPVIATPWSGPADFLSPRYTYTLRHSNPVPEKARNGDLLRYHVEPDLEHLIDLMRHVDRAPRRGQGYGAIGLRRCPPPLDMEKCGGHAGLPLRPVARAAHATAHGPDAGRQVNYEL